MKVKFRPLRIPKELRKRRQWICYDQEGDKKIPYIAGCEEGKKARTNDPETFRSFKEALQDVKDGIRDYIAFVITPEDPYVFLDLDECSTLEERELTKLVRQCFNSYTEFSVSGKGMHIIAKGELEGRGLHTAHLGIFDRYRGCIMTGHVWDGREKIYRANKKYLRSLQDKVRTSDGKGYDFDLEETEWDAQPWAVMSLASKIYGDKFHSLIDGRWQELGCYPSQSEADHALVNMFCDISDSNPLVRYLFAESGLYRDWKSRKDPTTGEYSVKGYLDYSIKSNRAKQEQRDCMKVKVQEDVKRQTKLREKAKKKSKKKAAEPAVESTVDDDLSDDVYLDHDIGNDFNYATDVIDKVPSKLVRMLARYIYENSYRPNQEIAILSALVCITMIVQRAFLTPTGTGLNLNIYLIAETGWGKDAFTKAVNMIIGELKTDLPKLGDNHVGKFASGEAIETVISAQPRFMSRVSEAGAFWRKLLSPHRPPHVDSLVEGILNLFMATDPNAFWQSRKKAKKDEDVVDSIFRPAGSFYGESTPEDLLGDLDLSSIGTGLLQRQLFYNIDSAEYVEANMVKRPMSRELKERLVELVACADSLDLTNETLTVRGSQRGMALLQDFSEGHSKYAYQSNKDTLKANLMNRSGIKAFRMASILGFDNPHEPRFQEAHARWAIDFVNKCDGFILDKFQSGDIGKGQLKQENDMMKIIHQVTAANEAKRRKSYRMNELCAADVSIIPYSFLKNKAKTRASFASDKYGAITAITKCIDSLCAAGTLVRLTRVECETEYDTAAGLLRYTGSG